MVYFGDAGMRVADVHAGDAAHQVDVLLSVLIVQKLLMALHHQKGIFVVVRVNWRDVGLAFSDLFVWFSGVWPWAGGREGCG